jgi:hypothetical protein
MDKLYQLYSQIEPYLPSFLKLHKALKKKGLNPNNVEWFVNAIEMGVVNFQNFKDSIKVSKIKYDIS